MLKKTGPYVGVTGFMTEAQLLGAYHTFLGALPEGRAGADMMFMAGFLVSSKTLAGERNRYPGKYPQMQQLSKLLQTDGPKLLRTIHFNTDDPQTIDDQIERIMRLASGRADGLQLNMRWLNPALMRRVRRRYPNLRIILQIGANALGDVTETEDIYLGETLRAYEGVIDDFLIDPSGGRSEPLDMWRAFACIADDEIPKDMQPGIAGGRNAKNVIEVRGLMRRLKRPVNIDAESQMFSFYPHSDPDKLASDPPDYLDMDKVVPYVKAAVLEIGGAMNKY